MMVRAMVSSTKIGVRARNQEEAKIGSDPMVREVVAHSVSLRATTHALGGSGSRRVADVGSWHIGGRMIHNDQELAVTRERVAKFERLLEDLRKSARPEEWPELSSGYRLEIERMQRDILDYLVQAPPGAKRTTAA